MLALRTLRYLLAWLMAGIYVTEGYQMDWSRPVRYQALLIALQYRLRRAARRAGQAAEDRALMRLQVQRLRLFRGLQQEGG